MNFLSGKREGEREGQAGRSAAGLFKVRLGLGEIEGKYREIEGEIQRYTEIERQRSKET